MTPALNLFFTAFQCGRTQNKPQMQGILLDDVAVFV